MVGELCLYPQHLYNGVPVSISLVHGCSTWSDTFGLHRNSFLGSIRTQTTLSTSIRETAICRVAILNNAWFEWEHHAPILRACPNIKEEHIRHILQAPQPKLHETVSANPAVSSVITKASSLEKWTEACHEADYVDEKHLAVIAYTDAMTLGVRVSDAVFERLKQNFSDREVVEITATIAAYNCVSRFLVALDVGERNAQERPAVHDQYFH